MGTPSRGRADAQRAFTDDTRAGAHTAAPRAAAPAAVPPAPPATVAAADPRPLTPQNAPGRRVRVAQSLWPRYPCTEHGGTGWEAVVVHATSATAVVSFTFARTRDGRNYQNERVPLAHLTPL